MFSLLELLQEAQQTSAESEALIAELRAQKHLLQATIVRVNATQDALSHIHDRHEAWWRDYSSRRQWFQLWEPSHHRIDTLLP